MEKNREIKFKAWDKQTKKMMFVENLYLEDEYMSLFTGNINDSKIIERKNRDVVLMQYTGLKDKNGVEIYEGDILDNYNNGVVYFFEGRFTPYYDGGDSEEIEDIRGWNQFVSVIGNIHQNPELLFD